MLTLKSSKKCFPLNINNIFSVTGAGSFSSEIREWAIETLTFKIVVEGPSDSEWDVTDYSSFEKRRTLYHDYPTQMEQKSTLPKFSWN
tara:strand:+ start:561 stop:824 length:264 start_codon:yes stop_codon:yes gene_type:complete